MDKIYSTEASRILGISRSTIIRMDEQKRLPADGTDPDGSRFWLRTTVLNYLAGKPKRSTFIFIRTAHLPDICAPEQSFRALVTGKVIPVDLSSTTQAASLFEVCTAISDTLPVAIGVGLTFASNTLFHTLTAFAAENGVCVLLIPDA